MLELIRKPEFKAGQHSFTLQEQGLRSVSQCLNDLEQEFDSQMISFFVARKRLRQLVGWKVKGDPEPSEADVRIAQIEVLAEWDAKKNEAADHGTKVHRMFELFLTKGEVLYPATRTFLTNLKAEYDQFYKEYDCEVMMCNSEFGTAGITDFIGIRNTKEVILDIDDFKTNLFKGIQFDSVSRKDDKIKHYNQFFKPPVAHLEQCNYNRYGLQLSIYALMLVLEFARQGIQARVGRIRLNFVEFNAETEIIEYSGIIPIPYLHNEAQAILTENVKYVTVPESQDW